MSRIEPATLAAAWQDALARNTTGGAIWDHISRSAKDARIKTARTVIEALSLVRFDWSIDALQEADALGLAILWQEKLADTGPDTTPWDALTRTQQDQRVAAARKVLTALRTASPAAVEPSPYAWGKLTVEAVREMLTMARDAQVEYHDIACPSRAHNVDAYNCASGKCDKQMVRLDHALEQLPAKQPAEPVQLNALVKIVVNPETQETRWFVRSLALADGKCWATVGSGHVYSWTEIVEIAQRYGVAVEILATPAA